MNKEPVEPPLDAPRGRVVPKPTPSTAHYWDGTRQGELRIQRCNTCDRHYFYPRPSCPHCGSGDVAWVVASGRARLHTYLINHRPAAGFDEPYAIAVVELEEGPRMMTNIVGVANTPEALELDMPLQVTFEVRGDQWIPTFMPATSP
jgi:uncharacterized OB-fold protein